MNVKKIIALSILLGFFLMSSSVLLAAGTKGKEFWLAFPQGDGNKSGIGPPTTNLLLLLTADCPSTVTVFDPGNKTTKMYSVVPGVTKTVTITRASEIDSATNDTITQQGIHVTSPNDISVFGVNDVIRGTDGYLGLPLTSLGTDYIVITYQADVTKKPSEFAIVATVDSTIVTITPSVTVGTRFAGVPYAITMNRGDTYQLGNATGGADLTGTSIQSTQPVGVYGANQCAFVPPGVSSCNHLVEQLLPTTSWGTLFISIPLATRGGGDTFRFLASQSGASVQVNGVVVATLGPGQFFETLISVPVSITADNPIYVTQYSNGRLFDKDQTSDPFMITVPPVTQYGKAYNIGIPAASFKFTANYENIYVPNSSTSSMFLNSIGIPPISFTPIGTSGYSGASILVPPGSNNVVTSSSGVSFGVVAYGFGTADGYGYPGGLLTDSVTCCGTTGLWPSQYHDTANSNRSELIGPTTAPVSPTWSFMILDAAPAFQEGTRYNGIVNNNGDVFFATGSSGNLMGFDRFGAFLFGDAAGNTRTGMSTTIIGVQQPPNIMTLPDCSQAVEFYPQEFGTPYVGYDRNGNKIFSTQPGPPFYDSSIGKYLNVFQDMIGTVLNGSKASRQTNVSTAPTLNWQTSAPAAAGGRYGNQFIYPPALSSDSSILYLTRYSRVSPPIVGNNGFLVGLDANTGSQLFVNSWNTDPNFVQNLSESGEFVATIPPTGIGSLALGAVLVVDDSIRVYPPLGGGNTPIWTAAPVVGATSFESSAAISPPIAGYPNGFVTSVDSNGTVYIYDLASSGLNVAPAHFFITGTPQFNLQSICVDAGGNIYFVANNNLLYGFNSVLTQLWAPITIPDSSVQTGPSIGLSPSSTGMLIIGGQFNFVTYN